MGGSVNRGIKCITAQGNLPVQANLFGYDRYSDIRGSDMGGSTVAY
jgi:hypothetical protein